jgi:L-iditol 2-dehydrogenase
MRMSERAEVMKAAFLDKPGHIYVQEVPVPHCGEGEVLIRVREVGICGSDLHYYQEGRVGDNVVRAPHILGHECSGVVVKAGARVQGLAPGDRVTIEPGLPCLACPRCLEGRYNLCPQVRFLGAPPNPGAFRELLAHDARFVYRLPDAVSFTQGALVEPLAVAHNAVTRVGVRAGDTVLIVGSGAIGFSCLEMALAAGAARVIVSDVQTERLATAALLGASTVNPRAQDVPARVAELTGGRMCDCAFEASGSEAGIADALRAVRKGGRVALIGLGLSQASLPYGEILKKEAAVFGVYRYANDYRPVLDLLAAGRLKADAWVSHRFPLGDIGRAMEMAVDPGVAKLKMMITME